LIAEKVTGQSYGKLLRDSILTPLNLDSTFLDVHDSVLYTIAHPWQAGRDNSATPRISLNSAAGAAGAMYSTSSEMLQWYNALINGKVINAQSIKEMTTFVEKERYGMGIAEYIVSGKPVWTHGGQIWGGYNSSMMYDPATGIIVCILTNQLPAQAFQISVQMLTTVWTIQSIKIYDIHGKLLMESTESTFSIAQLPCGTYQVRAYTVEEVRNYSLIKH